MKILLKKKKNYLASGTRTIIDIGGQDAKAIQVNPETGKVDKFRMNDKSRSNDRKIFLHRSWYRNCHW
ncbi:MAG: hypothetical protein MR503_01645 [Oscillospiraceae bacterium]|nr:hypothetical protein [Oscillospiraceae bacterium]